MTKVAIVTGASSGIGRHTAIALSKEGWNVVIAARRNDPLQETKNLMNLDNPGRCLAVSGDVTQEAFVKNLFEETVKTFGRLDMLFNNAGTGHPQVPIEEIPLGDFENVLRVNLVAPFLCTQHAMRIFKSQSPPGGRIINNGSVSAYIPRPFAYGYTASKHGLTGLTKTTALEGRRFNISCTQINIGTAMTDMGGKMLNGALQPDGRVIPEPVMDVEPVIESIMTIARLPNEVTVLETTIIPTGMPFGGRG
ncbi:hypothetical protein AAF712_006829 [Marasmius tenuissimus]|uniref:Short-chain dehydrogenase/reductase SDR n=1 Tax=Marasmius tenuissimus TaxID=585030 RepID=A0ABR2ZZJ6_9AGAR